MRIAFRSSCRTLSPPPQHQLKRALTPRHVACGQVLRACCRGHRASGVAHRLTPTADHCAASAATQQATICRKTIPSPAAPRLLPHPHPRRITAPARQQLPSAPLHPTAALLSTNCRSSLQLPLFSLQLPPSLSTPKTSKGSKTWVQSTFRW